MAAVTLKTAFSYIDEVKNIFANPDNSSSYEPKVFDLFMEIFDKYKKEKAGIPEVCERISNLFIGHPQLILGFNPYLIPNGYEIEVLDVKMAGTGDPGIQVILNFPNNTIETLVTHNLNKGQPEALAAPWD